MRLLKKITLWFLGVFFTLVILIYATFYFFQDTIKEKIVAAVNTGIHGQIEVGNVGLSLFANFPQAVIKLNDLRMYENKPDSTELVPVMGIGSLGATIHMIDAIKGQYNIQEVSLSGGSIYIINYKDSTLNILNALGESDEIDTTAAEGKIYVDLEKISISKVKMTYWDQLADQLAVSHLNSLHSKILLEGDSLSGIVDLDFQLDSMMQEGKRLLKSHSLMLSTSFESDLDKPSFRITNGVVKLDLLEANLEGIYNQADSGYVDMHISANHKDLSELAKMDVLNSEYLPDVRKGSLAIDARIKGKTAGKLPVVEADVSLKDMEVHNAFGKVIDKASFNAKLFTGIRQDMRDGKATFNNMEISFASGGYVKGAATIENFAYPNFRINWEAVESLDDLYRIFRFSDIKQMSGSMRSQANISGKFNLESNQLVSPKGALTATFNNCKIVLKEADYKVENLNGTVYVMDNDAGINGLSLLANGSDIALSTRINQLVPYVLGKPAQLEAVLSMQSGKLNTSRLLAFDTALANSTKYNIDSLDITVTADLSSRALDSYELVPSGKLEIKNLTALVEGIPSLRQFTGSIDISPDTLLIKKLKGTIGNSPIDLSFGVTNYATYLNTKVEKPMDITIGLQSDKLIAKDVFTINDKFLLPESYINEQIDNFKVNTRLITTNKELQKTELVPEFEFQVTGLQLKTVYAPVEFRDISVFGLIKDNNVYINGLFGKFGRSDVFLNAEFDNVLATKDTVSRPLKSRVSFNSGVLDLNELVKLDEATTEVTEVASDTTIAANPFADDFPILDLNVNIGEFYYYDVSIKNLSGIIKIEENNIIKLNQVTLQSGEYGSFEINGKLDASSRKDAVLSSNIKVSDVDLGNLNVSYVQNGENVRIGDHFNGVANGEIVADVPIDQNFNIDLARVTGKIKVKIKDGALINYAPLKEMGKYFKNKDLNNVRFDELKNTMVFNSGKMLLPFMTISTTIGTINLMGFQTMDYNMAYDIQVPIKLVAGAALNSLFAAKKDDDKKEDKIKQAGGKYVTVHISGNIDSYDFKLGKKHVLTPPPGFEVD